MCEHKIVSETPCDFVTICGCMIVTIAAHNFVDTPAALLASTKCDDRKERSPPQLWQNCNKCDREGSPSLPSLRGCLCLELKIGY